MRNLFDLLTDEEGATAIEYGLIAALVAVAAITAMASLGRHSMRLPSSTQTRQCAWARWVSTVCWKLVLPDPVPPMTRQCGETAGCQCWICPSSSTPIGILNALYAEWVRGGVGST